ncbi:MAG TPA: transcriptional regulator NrdR [Candidatus Polarisedimenticolia bacterium]|nr:transcriptional regulator NrdR [Candidatus Polarisedimenticolia bacterium]
MKCPFCGHLEDKVVDSREGKEGLVIRRRRECLSCKRRFTSYERIEEIAFRLIKKDGRREPFDRQKLMTGLIKACQKRSVPLKALEAIVDEIEAMLQDSPDKELTTDRVGAHVMLRLRELDKVAYVRFASVYRRFEEPGDFLEELKGLLDQKKAEEAR